MELKAKARGPVTDGSGRLLNFEAQRMREGKEEKRKKMERMDIVLEVKAMVG